MHLTEGTVISVFNLNACCAHFALARLVEALRYKTEGRVFDSRWCHSNFFFYNIILPAALWPLGWIQSLTEISTRNISWGGKGGRCVGLSTLPLSCTRLSWNLGASTSLEPSRSVQACNGIALLFGLILNWLFANSSRARSCVYIHIYII